MDLHPDFKDLLAEFARSKVSYAVLGGYAVGYHAKPRATKDLDLLLSGLGDNLQRAASALAAFGAPASVVNSVRTLTPSEIAYLGSPPVRVDLLRSADGIETESVIARAEIALVDGLSIPMIALDDLIANKRAAGRPQDLADVALLERVKALGKP
jgi:predicted nucleotidyltransferase